MRVELDQASKGRGDDALQPVTVTFESGAVTLVRAETEHRPTVLGLLASGRMHPDTGVIRLDGAVDYAGMRDRIALVDAPTVSDPPAHVSTVGIVEEEPDVCWPHGHGDRRAPHARRVGPRTLDPHPHRKRGPHGPDSPAPHPCRDAARRGGRRPRRP
ncbi:hypothetical protein [Demequina litorisediminis]|uniref:hypothetical protein n=1 Tax=Demequina litorisediminis TaxID=1849022 RepID=UPI0024E16BB6|nr:hypothetical protein [Demequina litorisediminis]